MNIFERNVIGIWGSKGEEWLKSLPNLVAHIAVQWGLRKLTPLPHLSYNYVLEGFRNADDLPIILKLSCELTEFGYEVNALKNYQSSGSCIPILEVDECNRAILMEKAIPGYSLATLFPDQDEIAISCASKIIKKLHSARIMQTAQFPKLSEWLQCFDRASNNALPSEHIQKAQKLSEHLLKTTYQEVLLHGDLHYDNILKHDDSWISIDPKGVIGDSAFEVSHVCVRRDGMSIMTTETMQHRYSLFSKHLNLDTKRISQWAYVQAVMSACWFVEDQGDPTFSIELANTLENCLTD